MRTVFSCIALNMSYTLRSVKFWGAAAMYLLLIYFYAGTDDIMHDGSAVYYILQYTLQNGGTLQFGLVACAIPAAALFADEWCSGRFIYSYMRAKKRGYAVSVILSSFLAAALVSIIATTVYVGLLSLSHPLTGDVAKITFIQAALRSYANGGLMVKGHYFAYYLVTILTQACCMGIFSALATMLSVKITNVYAAIVSPMILYLLVTNLFSIFKVPFLLNPYNIYDGSNNILRVLSPGNGENFTVISMLYPFIYTVAVLVIISVISYFWIRQKYEKTPA